MANAFFGSLRLDIVGEQYTQGAVAVNMHLDSKWLCFY